MPLMRIVGPKGAIDFAQKRALAAAFTDLLLVGEGGSAVESARKVVHILFQEVDPSTDWFVGGEPRGFEPEGAPAHFFLDVFYPQASAPPSAKRQLHRALNDTFVRIVFGLDAPTNALSNWIVVHEIDEGAWGVRGNTIGVEDIFRANEAAPERLVYAKAVLAAESRLRAQAQFPVDPLN